VQDLNRKLAPALAAEILAATGLLLWRIWELLKSGNTLDWLGILAVYWLFCIGASGKRIWAPVTIATAALLTLLYAWGEVPFAFAGLGLSR
jgi:hypothetical protein